MIIAVAKREDVYAYIRKWFDRHPEWHTLQTEYISFVAHKKTFSQILRYVENFFHNFVYWQTNLGRHNAYIVLLMLHEKPYDKIIEKARHGVNCTELY